MADGVRRKAADATAPAAPARGALPASAPSRAERARRSAYRGRFAALFVVLAVVAGAAIGTTLVLLDRESPAPAPPWSEWQPEGSAERRVTQIADRVADPYRLPSGRQLASAIAGPAAAPTANGGLLPIRAILVQPQTSQGQAEATDVDIVDARNSVMYVLCSIGGDRCAIPEGKPSAGRLALLRRQALELALYTFKYVDTADSVAVLLPPNEVEGLRTAVLLERSDVRAELSRPLERTLTAPLVPGVGEIGADELRAIERITRPRLYAYEFDLAQDGSPIMVLAPALV